MSRRGGCGILLPDCVIRNPLELCRLLDLNRFSAARFGRGILQHRQPEQVWGGASEPREKANIGKANLKEQIQWDSWR